MDGGVNLQRSAEILGIGIDEDRAGGVAVVEPRVARWPVVEDELNAQPGC